MLETAAAQKASFEQETAEAFKSEMKMEGQMLLRKTSTDFVINISDTSSEEDQLENGINSPVVKKLKFIFNFQPQKQIKRANGKLLLHIISEVNKTSSSNEKKAYKMVCKRINQDLNEYN